MDFQCWTVINLPMARPGELASRYPWDINGSCRQEYENGIGGQLCPCGVNVSVIDCRDRGPRCSPCYLKLSRTHPQRTHVPSLQEVFCEEHSAVRGIFLSCGTVGCVYCPCSQCGVHHQVIYKFARAAPYVQRERREIINTFYARRVVLVLVLKVFGVPSHVVRTICSFELPLHVAWALAPTAGSSAPAPPSGTALR